MPHHALHTLHACHTPAMLISVSLHGSHRGSLCWVTWVKGCHEPSQLDRKQCQARFNYYEYERSKFASPSASKRLIIQGLDFPVHLADLEHD